MHRWGLALVVVAGAAIALLPPRSSPSLSTVVNPHLVRWIGEDSVREWRIAIAEGREKEAATAYWALSFADTVERAIARALPRRQPAPLLIDRGNLSSADRDTIRAELRRAWADAAIGSPAATVAVVIVKAGHVREALGKKGQGFPDELLLLPKAGGHPSCILVMAWRLEHGERSPASLRGIGSMLGPCAFVAAFGHPGPSIRLWFVGRQLERPTELESYDWRPGELVRLAVELDGVREYFQRRWELTEHLRPLEGLPESLACISGDRQRCTNAILGAQAFGDSPHLHGLGIIEMDSKHWSWSDEHEFADGENIFLADLVRAKGRDRFLTFWQSDRSVEDAFLAAYGESLGDWTYRWAIARYGPWSPGPHVRLSSVLSALAISIAFLALATTAAHRRQVA